MITVPSTLTTRVKAASNATLSCPCSLNEALRSIQHFLRSDERLFAYLDDIYVVCAPERVGVIHARLEVDLWEFPRIQDSRLEQRHYPPGCTQLTAAAQAVDPHAGVWRWRVRGPGPPRVGDSHRPTCFRAFRAPPEDCLASVLFERIPAVQNLPSAWLILLYCANTRANCWLRGVPREEVAQFASEHDAATQLCLSRLLVVLVAEVGGRWSEETSVSMPAHKSGPCPSSSVLAPSSPGTSVGCPSSLALPRELWHLRSSRTAGVLARMAQRHPRAMS